MSSRPQNALDARTPPAGPPAEWLGRLLAAERIEELAALLVGYAEADAGCAGATVVWALDRPEACRREPARRLDAGELALVHAALTAQAPRFGEEGRRVAVRLFQPHGAVLLLDVAAGSDGWTLVERLALPVQLAARQMNRAQELAQLTRSHDRLRRSDALQRALFSISELAVSERGMQNMLCGIHAIVSQLMYAENFFIALHDPERDDFRMLYYADTVEPDSPLGDQAVPLDRIRHSLTWYVIRRGASLMGRTDALAGQVDGPLSMLGPDCHEWLGVPMLRGGRVEGAVVVQSYCEGVGYSHEDRSLLGFVGNHILTALERKRGSDELNRRVEQRTRELARANHVLQQEVLERQRAEQLQAALFEMAQLATADIGEQAFYRKVHAVVGSLINAENFFIALLDDDGAGLTFPYAVDLGDAPYAPRPLGRGLSEHVLRQGACVFDLAQIRAMIERGEMDAGAMGSPVACWLGAPLRVGEHAIGLVAVQSYAEDVAYGDADRELLTFVAAQIATSLQRRRDADSLHRANHDLERRVTERTRALRREIAERERMQEKLRHQVLHDPLTGLPNRGYLHARLDTVLERLQREPEQRCALLYIDVDRFKIVNDSLGHQAGDDVLRIVAARLSLCVRHPDVVARLSGDEFAILIEDVDGPQPALAVAQRVLERLDAPLQVCGRELAPSASIGIAVGDAGYRDGDELVRDADVALYRAKRTGRRRFELFDEDLARTRVDVLTLEGELRRALAADQLQPHFQPICRLRDGAVVGYEALARWHHPERGLLHPQDFIPIAEDSHQVDAIDWRLFELACRHLAARAPADVFLTLNVSAQHLRHEGFDVRLRRMLGQTGLAPGRLVVEVTEGSLMDEPERVRDTLGRLRTVGVGAALDDFGTGYSSLSYLHSLPLGMLKIDRSFVHALDAGDGPGSATVVRAILALADTLGMRVVAEGIETPAQRQALLDMGCELGQGFLLGCPQPAVATASAG